MDHCGSLRPFGGLHSQKYFHNKMFCLLNSVDIYSNDAKAIVSKTVTSA